MMKEKNVKKKIISVVIVFILILVALCVIGLQLIGKNRGTRVITSSQLESAIQISQLSTAEFIYNGIAEKYKDNNSGKVECYISYNANVKVGIEMEDVKFYIDEEAKTVTPVLPEVTVNIAALDEKSIGYIPKNPDIALKEVIAICKEDAMNEANQSQSLYEAAEENLRAVIEVLLSPILENAGYSLKWEADKAGGV